MISDFMNSQIHVSSQVAIATVLGLCGFAVLLFGRFFYRKSIARSAARLAAREEKKELKKKQQQERRENSAKCVKDILPDDWMNLFHACRDNEWYQARCELVVAYARKSNLSPLPPMCMKWFIEQVLVKPEKTRYDADETVRAHRVIAALSPFAAAYEYGGKS